MLGLNDEEQKAFVYACRESELFKDLVLEHPINKKGQLGMLAPEESNQLRQEKSLEQKLKMERLEMEGLQDEDSSSHAKSHSVEDKRFDQQDERYYGGVNGNINDLSGPQELSNSREADSAGTSGNSGSEDGEKDEEDV